MRVENWLAERTAARWPAVRAALARCGEAWARTRAPQDFLVLGADAPRPIRGDAVGGDTVGGDTVGGDTVGGDTVGDRGRERRAWRATMAHYVLARQVAALTDGLYGGRAAGTHPEAAEDGGRARAGRWPRRPLARARRPGRRPMQETLSLLEGMVGRRERALATARRVHEALELLERVGPRVRGLEAEIAGARARVRRLNDASEAASRSDGSRAAGEARDPVSAGGSSSAAAREAAEAERCARGKAAREARAREAVLILGEAARRAALVGHAQWRAALEGQADDFARRLAQAQAAALELASAEASGRARRERGRREAEQLRRLQARVAALAGGDGGGGSAKAR
jgi:hypothetical protein